MQLNVPGNMYLLLKFWHSERTISEDYQRAGPWGTRLETLLSCWAREIR